MWTVESGPFHTGDQLDTTVEVRPDDCIDLNGAFHTWLWSDIWSYDTNLGRITLNLDQLVVRPAFASVKRASGKGSSDRKICFHKKFFLFKQNYCRN